MPAARLIPEDILAFLEKVTGKIAFIEDRTLGGHEIETDIGDEHVRLVADTPEEVVLAYFWHVHQVYSNTEKNLGRINRIRKRFSLESKRVRELEETSRTNLACLNEFARLHNLRPPPPKDDEADP